MDKKALRYLVSGILLGTLALSAYQARAGGAGTTGIAYTGQLRNNGVTDSTPHNFIFNLVDGTGATVGCPADARPALAVNNGRFSVPTLFSACTNLSSILTNTPSTYVRVSVDGQVLSPDQALGAVPYALHALYADSAGTTVFASYSTSHHTTISADNTNFTLSFNTPIVDTHSAFSTVTNTYTVPVAGVYSIIASTRFSGTGCRSGAYWQIGLSTSASSNLQSQLTYSCNAAAGSTDTVTVTGLVKMAIGDTVSVSAADNASASFSTIGESFSITKVAN